MEWQGKKVLVTGAGGFIGSHLVEKLVGLGAKVSCFLKYNSLNNWEWIEDFPEDVKNKVKIIFGDLKDGDSVRNASKDQEVIFHLGALISIPYSYVNPRDVVQTNVLGTFNVLIAAKENNVKKVIHTSTSETYGTAIYVPIDEKHPLQGQSPYSASKIGADKIAESFQLSFGLPIVTIRPFNTYGPRQSTRAVIPTIITQALVGDEIKLGSLDPVRDLTFVKDTAEGFIKAAEAEGVIGETINLGAGKGITIRDLTKKIIEIIGKDIKIIQDKERIRPEESEVKRLIADVGKAKELLGWTPKTSFEEGLKETVEWISKNLNRYKVGQYTI